MDPSLSLLKQLVEVNSINPSLVPGAPGEARIAEVIGDYMRRAGLDVQLEEAAPGRPNAIGVLEGREPGRSLILCGHMDTVGVDGMPDPFVPRERDGRIYGRGSQDMKGGVAAMVDAARLLAANGFRKGRVIIAAVADEEYASVGADAFVGRWRADAAVVTEPTDLQIGTAHKGFAWIDVATRGRAAHGSRPKDGRDAILRMGRVLTALESLDRELQARQPHPVMGTGSLHASIVAGGVELSSYPDRCTLRMERRLVTGETGDTAVEEVRAILARARAVDPEFEGSAELTFWRSAYEVDRSHELPRGLEAAAQRTGTRAGTVGMSFWTDAAVLAGAGIPSVLFGPGGAGLHSVEEYVNAADVVMCRDVLAHFAAEWC
jgi:acetylornithine deacetylase